MFTDALAFLEPLMKQIAPQLDATLTVMSLAGLVLHHLEVRKLIPLVPGGSEAKASLPVLAEHITTLMLAGVES